MNARDEDRELARPFLLSILMIVVGLGIWQWQDRLDKGHPATIVEQSAP
ncbi:MAG TPA: hypothetical protein VH598_15600 [Verrucomicrobiae bacterium]|jgi:hypothetical protein|nr:hypothetical protein [Verrucomicrobiae bacterium]